MSTSLYLFFPNATNLTWQIQNLILSTQRALILAMLNATNLTWQIQNQITNLIMRRAGFSTQLALILMHLWLPNWEYMMLLVPKSISFNDQKVIFVFFGFNLAAHRNPIHAKRKLVNQDLFKFLHLLQITRFKNWQRNLNWSESPNLKVANWKLCKQSLWTFCFYDLYKPELRSQKV